MEEPDRKTSAEASLRMDCKMDSHREQADLECSGPERLERGVELETSVQLFSHFVPAAGMVKALVAIIMADTVKVAMAKFVSIASSLVSIIEVDEVQAKARAVVISSERPMVMLKLEVNFAISFPIQVR